MKTIRVWDNGLPRNVIDEIVRELRDGAIMVWPTDTLYGVACDALNPKAIDAVCRLKGLNPDKNTLSIVCSDISQASEYARIENEAFRLIKRLAPGPYTFILRAASRLPKAFKGRKTVGIRIPGYEPARAIAEALGNPLLNTSIDFADEDYAVSPGLIAEAYEGRADIMLEGPDGLTEPSTVIDCTTSDFTIVREGAGKEEV
ncbi:MAG: L-threonylcarbamoyladenylate synthase [Muribaculaceae bacterium]|nr:L-threonylcarbamoyladenylate synthase [Muribaculaceae bacterium]